MATSTTCVVGGTPSAVLTLPAKVANACLGQARLRFMDAPAELGGLDHWLLWHNRVHRDPAIRWLIDLIAGHCAADIRSSVEEEEALLEAAE